MLAICPNHLISLRASRTTNLPSNSIALKNHYRHLPSPTYLLFPCLQHWHTPLTMTSALTFHTHHWLLETEEGTLEAGPLLPSGGQIQRWPEKPVILEVPVSPYCVTLTLQGPKLPQKKTERQYNQCCRVWIDWGTLTCSCSSQFCILFSYLFLPIFFPLTPSLIFNYFHFSISLSVS